MGFLPASRFEADRSTSVLVVKRAKGPITHALRTLSTRYKEGRCYEGKCE